MDNLFEILVPLIFAAIYFFGNMFSKKSDDDAAPPGRAADEDADAIERQRRIQEEIRRKIMERRRGEQDSPRSEPIEGRESGRQRPAESNADAAYRERRAALEQRRQEQQKEKQSSRDRHTADRQLHRHPDSQIPDTSYGNEMQAKLQQIEATKRHAEKLKKQAAERTSSLRPVRHSNPVTSGSRIARGPLRATLRNPSAARTAFIYGEVLGPPVSQKKSQTVPGLSRADG